MRLTSSQSEWSRLSPTLFGICAAELIHEHHTKFPELKFDDITSIDDFNWIWAFLYVDDMVLIARSARQLQHMIDACQDWSERSRMKINHDKTKIMVFYKTPAQRASQQPSHFWLTPWFPLNNPPTPLPLDEPKDFTYLGLKLDPQMTMQPATTHTCQKINWANQTVSAIAHSLKHDTRETRTRPLILYRIWQSLFLATRLMRAHHISSILWEVDLVPHICPGQKAEYAACFWVCTLSPFCCTECRGIFPRKPAKYFSNPQSQTRSKMSKKKLPAAPKKFMVQNKESTWCASIFRSKYSRNGHLCILVCRMYQICANHAKSVSYFLVLKGEIRGNWPLSLCKVCCSCDFTTGPQIPTKICLSVYYSTIVDWNLYKKWPNFGTTPLQLLNCSRTNGIFNQLWMRINLSVCVIFFFQFKSYYYGVISARGVRNIKIERHPVRSC